MEGKSNQPYFQILICFHIPDEEHVIVKILNLQHNHPANVVKNHVKLPEGSLCN